MTSLSKLSTPLFVAGGIATIAYAGTCLALYNYQDKLIFRPLPFLLRNPAEVGLAYEDVWIPLERTSQPKKLHGWWMPNPGSHRTLLLCHGNYGNVSYNIDRCRFYHDLGFSILSFDYRGYGLSHSEPPSEQRAYEDAEAALRYLTANRQIVPSTITVLGHSLGGAIAINLAAQHRELNSLIVECSFTSMKEAVHAKKIYRIFPVEQLLNHAFDSLSKVPDLKIPVLYVHGDRDTDVPSMFSQQLFEASPAHKQIWVAIGAGHNNITTEFKAAYKETATAFLSQLAAIEEPAARQLSGANAHPVDAHPSNQ
ncbi:MAG: alpha/beta hydrolase [Phormidesmis sp.]